ncbi:NAD(P)/FAD-dependent oxidoreductase [Deferribacteraceae bacterium V6Fe1]|nr:NAD(P)/FAD-dependent oxidoreductase [Deferribacteraceae bacterium V6Fe1]
MMKVIDILIIGNSAAGINAAKTIRKHNKDISLGIIDRENCPAYSRVMTPYYIGKKCSKESLYLTDNQFYKNLNIATFFGLEAVELNIEAKCVTLSNSSKVYFNKLIIATGAEATSIDILSDKSTVLRHMSDAEKLDKLLNSAKSVTAIGAGLVSIPVLSHLKNDVEKNLIVGSGRIFSRVLDKDASLILEEKLKNKGLNIYKNDDISSYYDNSKLSIKLKSGKCLDTDVLLIGKGVTPNVQLALKSGINCNNGILINDYCQTNIDFIYAAGDVAEGKDFISGNKVIQGNWITAVEQGEIAGLNAIGIKVKYEGSLKNNTTEVFGYDLAVIGYFYDDAPKTKTFYDNFTGIYRKIFLDSDNTVIGATLLNNTNEAGIYYDMIKTREKFSDDYSLSKNNTYAQKLYRIA